MRHFICLIRTPLREFCNALVFIFQHPFHAVTIPYMYLYAFSPGELSITKP